MGLLDNIWEIPGMLKQGFQDWNNDPEKADRVQRQIDYLRNGPAAEPQIMAEHPSAGPVLEAAMGAVPAVGGFTLKDLVAGPKGAFQKLIKGPVGEYEGFVPFSNYAKRFSPSDPIGNREQIERILSQAKSIMGSHQDVTDLKNMSNTYGLEETLNNIFQKSGSNPLLRAKVSRSGSDLTGGHYISGEKPGIIDIFYGSKASTPVETALHEVVHDNQYTNPIIQNLLIENKEKINRLMNRFIAGFPERSIMDNASYLIKPKEAMARGVTSEIGDRIGFNAVTPEFNWYMKKSWPEELNPLWSKVADILMRGGR